MGRRIALLVANTEYKDDYFRQLVTPGQNIRDFERVLRDPERCGFEVIPLINASKPIIEKEILTLFKNKTQDDFLVFYFAGHGFKDSDGALHFAIHDTEHELIEVTAISASFIKSFIDKSVSERIVVIFDCCFSGDFSEIPSESYDATINLEGEFQGNGHDRIILTATDAMQYAWNRDTGDITGEADHSLFTKYLIDGITTGKADRDGDGKITIDELFSYVHERVVKTFPQQNPKKIAYHADDTLIFAKNPTLNQLSSDLDDAIEHHNHFARKAAVAELDELLYLYDGQNQELVNQVQNRLKRLSSDSNEQISRYAQAVLKAFNSRNTVLLSETKKLTLFIALPEDISDERIIINQVVDKLNNNGSIGVQAQLSIVTWDNPNSYLPIIASEPAAKQSNRQTFVLKNIRKFLMEGFEADELSRLCYDEEKFRPVYDQLAVNTGKDTVVDKLLQYAGRQELLEELLALVKEHNPRKYEKFQPYISTIGSTQSGVMSEELARAKNINKEILRPAQCDIVVVIFRSSFGPLFPGNILKDDGTQYESLTEWEYEDAASGARMNDGRPFIWIYRSNQPIFRADNPNRKEMLEQCEKVDRFCSKFEDKADAHYTLYNNLEQFRRNLEENLRSAVRRLVTKASRVQSKQFNPEIQNQEQEAGHIQALLEPYLNWIIEQHSQLELRGIGGGDARLPTIPLEKVYVALKGRRTNAYELEQAQQLLYAEMAEMIEDLGGKFTATHLAQIRDDAQKRAIIANPNTPSMIDRDLPNDLTSSNDNDKGTVETLGDAFRKNRWMIILGDPGSGKTTLARWIVLKLASAMLNNEARVKIPKYQVDPKLDRSDMTEIDIGPARLPVLLRVSAFAKARHDNDTVSLADFLGQSFGFGQNHNLPPQDLNTLIKYYLRVGRAVIILDGMDEITTSRQRIDVVKSIEAFINVWINAHGEAIPTDEKFSLWNPQKQGEPAKTGGNQIIITSRIVGYRAAPIAGPVTHVTIQPMQKIAIEHFCDSWTLATHQLLKPHDDEETVRQQAVVEAAGLKAAIFDPDRPGVRRLATNPLLITILALVYRNNEWRLPEQRSELYQRAMKILIEDWRNTKITTDELIYVLSPLAAHIHQHYSEGAIKEDEMKEIITNELAKYRRYDDFNLPPAFVSEVDEFIDQVRKDIGLLSERSNQIYGFLHLTFQEYLVALYLIRDKQKAAVEIINKLDDPRWREPILMALGHISVAKNWGPKARQHLLTSLLEADDPLGDLIPRTALLIVSAIPEMAWTSEQEQILHEVIHRLLVAYAGQGRVGGFETLREQIQTSLTKLYKSGHKQTLEQHLANALINIKKDERNLGLAAAELIVRNKWFSPALTKALIKAFPYDDANWKYPITKALNTMTILNPEEEVIPHKPELSKTQSRELDRLEKLLGQIEDGSLERDLENRITELEKPLGEEEQKDG